MELSLKRDTKLLNQWVPRWLGVLMFVLLFFPILFVNGAYSSTSGEMVSGLGIITEHIQFANFASAIGMVVFAPFLVPILRIRRPKILFIVGLIGLFITSLICARTTSMPLLFLCSLVMGAIRIVLILNTLFTLLDYLTGMDIVAVMIPVTVDPSAKKDESMTNLKALAIPLIYFFFLSLGQLGSGLTAWLAYEYEWQYVYWFMCGFVLASMFLVLTLMKYQPKKRKNAAMGWIHFGDMVAASFSLLSFSFILIYGKTYDWFDNSLIRLAGGIFLISTGALLFLSANSKTPYINLDIFQSRKVNTALLLFFLLMVLNSNSMLVNVFTGVSMKLDNLKSANLGNWSLVGYTIGSIVALVMTIKKVPFKYMFALGFALITASAAYMYFQYQGQGVYKNMIFPIIVRSTGMFMLYALCGAYGMLELNMSKHFGAWIFLMLAIRSVVGPVGGVSLYSNAVNQRTEHYIARLSHNVDRMNPEIAGSYQNTQFGMMMQGKSYENAEQVAAMSTKGRIQVQAVLAALKEITGWTIYAGAGCVVFVLIYPYNKRRKKKRKRKYTENGTRNRIIYE